MRREASCRDEGCIEDRQLYSLQFRKLAAHLAAGFLVNLRVNRNNRGVKEEVWSGCPASQGSEHRDARNGQGRTGWLWDREDSRPRAQG